MSRVVMITGTSKGIGKELCSHYLEKGFVVAGCSHGQSGIKDENYRHFSLDIGDESAVVDMVRAVKREFDGIDVLINNAGIASMNHILTTPTSSMDRVLDTNLKGTFLFLREVAKVMSPKAKSAKQNHFRIVNFSTIAAPLNLEGEAVYAASKAAIESITKVSAKELASFGITVNAIAPTPIKTDLIKAVPENKINELLQKQAIKRFGEFDDVKNVIDFFIDEKSDFVTAQIIYLGGITN